MPDPGYSSPEFPNNGPSRPKVSRKLILGAATAVVIAAGAGMAATGYSAKQAQPTPSPTGVATPGFPTAPGATPTNGRERRMEGPFGAIHGQLVVPKQGGGYENLTTQTGVVTSIQQSSMAVRSEDGFARTYTIDNTSRICAGRDGLTGVKAGHRVWVIGSGQGTTLRAILITDLTQPPWPPWAGAPGVTGSPQPTTPTPPTSPEMTPSPGVTGSPEESPLPTETTPEGTTD